MGGGGMTQAAGGGAGPFRWPKGAVGSYPPGARPLLGLRQLRQVSLQARVSGLPRATQPLQASDGTLRKLGHPLA